MPGIPDGNVTAFRFSEEELELLGVIQGHTGIHSRMEALRAVLRYYAEAEGLLAPAQKAEVDAGTAQAASQANREAK